MRKLALSVMLASTSLGSAAWADTADGDSLIGQDWDSIVAMARGGTVNWFMWGGADNINAYVNDYIGGILRDQYGITLRQVPVANTVEAVNIVLGEVEAGNMANGSVDLIWINGENFRTMKQGNLAWCGYNETLPNNVYVDWDNPAVANDFGLPVDGCQSPWSRAQFAFAYDPARTENPPRSIGELIDWVRANPGEFTYPAPPDFTGSVMIRHIFYHVAGGVDDLLGDFNQEVFDDVSSRTWTLLNELKPYMWRQGRTFPASVTQLNELFANQEVALTFNYNPSQFGIAVEAGLFPDTVRSYGLDDGTIGNTNYTLIPINSPNKAAALVLQNVLLSPEAQLEKARPTVWGAPPGIEMDRTSPAIQAEFAALPRHPSVVSTAELAQNSLPELQSEWLTAIDRGWTENVRQ